MRGVQAKWWYLGIVAIIAFGFIIWPYILESRKSSENVAGTPQTKSNGMILTQTGLELVNFGDDETKVIDTLSEKLGTPSKDTGWIDSFSPYGTCPGKQIRVVEWGRLRVYFGDTSYGEKKFFTYDYTSRDTDSTEPSLATVKGLTLGEMQDQIALKHPEGAILPVSEGMPQWFTLIRSMDASQSLGGTIENGKIFWLSGGLQCGE